VVSCRQLRFGATPEGAAGIIRTALDAFADCISWSIMRYPGPLKMDLGGQDEEFDRMIKTHFTGPIIAQGSH
jgi:hypothetical protein